MTPWTENLLSDADDLVRADRPRAAFDCLLTVLTVHPDDPEALRLAASLAYGRPRRDEPDGLTTDDLRDPRLDAMFCHCDASGCTASWISAGQIMDGEIHVTNPIGGRCTQGHGYYCRNHFAENSTCPRCGGRLDYAPRVPNGRPSTQTLRLNRTLVHVFVMWEGTGRISGDSMTALLTAVSPDVFEDDAKITGITIGLLGDDPEGLLLAYAAKHREDYLDDTYKLYTYDGRDGSGNKWGLLKVFTAAPKHVDPDDPPTMRETQQEAPPLTTDAPPPSLVAEDRPKRRWWRRR